MSTSHKVTTSLLLLTQTLHDLKYNARHLIEESFKLTHSNLFIYINPLLGIRNQSLIIQDKFNLRALVNQFYQSSYRIDPNVNVVCLLHNIHNHGKHQLQANSLNYDLILSDFNNQSELSKFVSVNLPSQLGDAPFHFIECPKSHPVESPASNIDEYDQIAKNKTYRNSIIGGTFDRLHIGHKMLLSECVLLTENRLLIGVADGPLLAKKKLGELIEDLDERSAKLKQFLHLVSPSLDVITTPIHDPFGPSITEADYQCLIVSQETFTGGIKVNEKRVENKLPVLDIHVVGLVKEDEALLSQNTGDEDKVSSSNERRRLLGTLLRPPRIPYDKTKPYLIGLTGGLASGKTHIRKDLENMGLATVDCDKLGHKAYIKGTNAYNQIIETFGKEVVNSETGEIDRKELGKRVFQAPGELKKLTDIVWPEIARLRELEVDELFNKGHKIIVVEAAVLIEAGQHLNMNEVWVCFISDEEATRRAVERDNSNVEKVKGALNAQLPNKERLKHANVAFCSLWSREYTVKQVEKAYKSLLARINN